MCTVVGGDVARWFLASSCSLCSFFKVHEFVLKRAVSVVSYVIVVCELHQPGCCSPRGLGFLPVVKKKKKKNHLGAREPRKMWIYIEILISPKQLMKNSPSYSLAFRGNEKALCPNVMSYPEMFEDQSKNLQLKCFRGDV